MAKRQPSPHSNMKDLLKRLVRVPKDEIDERERAYQAERKDGKASAHAGQIVPLKPA